MKKKSFLSKVKNVFTSADFLCGFKRMNIAFLTVLVCFTLVAMFGEFPTAHALVTQQDDFHTIDGCWYSLTPTTLTGMSVQTQENGNSGSQYTKYCYTIVDENSNIKDQSNYQYIVDESNEVYVFEYYTWLDSTTTDTKKIAVYSETGLKQNKDIDGKKYYTFANGTNGQYVFESVDEYLYYRLYRFLPDWQNNNTVYYSQDDKLTFDDNEYFGYQLLNDDIYNTYKDVNVYTEYKFEVGDTDYIRYSNISVDSNGNIIAGISGSTDTSEYQIINRNDINQLTYVLERKGDAYVTTDMNGKQIGTSGFSTKMYYAGGQMYIYDDNFQIDTPNGKQTVSGFKIYSILSSEAAGLVDYSSFDINKYTMIRFSPSTNELIVEAERYYDLYEITYDLVQNTSTTTESNKTEAYLTGKDAEVNCEVSYDKNNPSQFQITYNYTIQLRNDYAYKIKYRRYNFKYSNYNYTTDYTYTYNLTAHQTNVAINTGEYAGSLTDFQNATQDTLNTKYNSGSYTSNSQYYYNLSKTVNETSATLNYNSNTVTAATLQNNSGTGTLTSYSWSGGSNTSEYVTNDVSSSTYSATTYSLDANGLVSYSTSSKSAYNIGNYYYTSKSSPYMMGYQKAYTITKVSAGSGLTSLPSLNYASSSSFSLNTSSYYNATQNGTYTYGLSYSSGTQTTLGSASYSSTSYPASYSGYSNVDDYGLSNFMTFTYTQSSNQLAVSGSTTKKRLWYRYYDDSSSWDYYYLDIGLYKCTDTDYSYSDGYENNVRKSSTILNNYYFSIKVTYTDNTTGWLEGSSTSQTFTLTSGKTPKSLMIYIPVRYQNDYGDDYSDWRINNDYYHAVYTANFTTKTVYNNVTYYKCTWGATSSYTYFLKSNYASTFTLNTTTGTKYFYYQVGSSGIYYYYSGGYTKPSSTVTYYKGKQVINSSNTKFAQDRTIIPAIQLALNDLTSGTNAFPLTSDKIETIKNLVINQGISYSNVTMNTPTVDATTGKITATGKIEQTVYSSGGAKSLGTASYSFTLTQSPNSTNLPITWVNYYNTYKVTYSSSTGSETKASTANSTTTSSTRPNTTSYSSATYNTVNTVSTTSQKVFVKTRTRNKNVLQSYVATSEYVYAYSNTAGATTSSDGKYYSEACGPSNTSAFTLPIYTAGLVGSKGYKYVEYTTNTDVGNTITFTKTFTVNANNQYGSTNVGTTSGSYADYRQFASNQGFDNNKVVNATATISNIVNLYNATLKRYSFTLKEVGKEYAYGSTSNNFGSSNIKVDSYYNNIQYDTNGKITNRSESNWNGSYTLPTAYNLFDETTYFKGYNKEMRVSTSSGITTYTLYNKLNLVSAVQNVVKNQGTTTKTYYISYYLNGTLKKYQVSGSSSYLSNFNVTGINDIGSDTSNGYTISRIMITTNSSKHGVFSEYAKISTNQVNSKDDYAEKIRVYNYQIDYKWYETDTKATATITNLSSLINENGQWTGTTPQYSYTINGKTFTYSGNTINYTRGNEYTGFSDSNLRMVYKSQNKNFGYYLTKRIVITESELGYDYYNVSQAIKNGEAVSANPELAKQGIDGMGYYNYFSKTEKTITNTKNATIKINNTPFAAGSYVSKDSTLGKLSLYYEKNKELQDIYLVYNRTSGTYKLIKASKVTNYKYQVYYDANKVTSNGGLTFTYGDKGFEVENGEFLQLKKDGSGKPIKDGNGNYVYDTIYRSSLVENVNGTLNTLLSKGINNYTGNLVSNGKNSTSIGTNNIVNKLVNPSDATILFGDTNIVDSTNSSFNYNGYSSLNGTEQFISSNYKNNDKNYLLLLETTIANGMDSSYNNYLDAYYQDKSNNMYRLKDDTATLYNSYGENLIPKFSRYKQYLLEGRWQQTNLEDWYYQNGDNMPDEIASSKIKYTNFLSKQWNLGNGAYLGKVSYDGSPYNNLIIGEDVDLAIVQNEDGNYVFEYYNNKENISFGNNAKIENLLTSNDIAEDMIKNKTNSIYYASINTTASTNSLLIKKDKVKLYSLTQKIPYNLVTIVEEDNVDKLSTLDMRYQFNATEFMKTLKTTADSANVPIYIKGDNLRSVFKIDNIQYDYPGITSKVQGGTIFNGTIASNKKQGVLKPGIFTASDGKEYVEVIYYQDKIYKLGSILGDGSMNLEDFERYSKELKTILASAITAYMNENPNKPKDGVGLTNYLAGEFYSSTFQKFVNKLGITSKNEEAFKTDFSNLFTSTLFDVYINLKDVDFVQEDVSVDVSTGTSSLYNQVYKALSVTTNDDSSRKINRSSNYIRVGNACYYEIDDYENYFSYRGVDVAINNADIGKYNTASLWKNVLNLNVYGFLFTAMMHENDFFSAGNKELAYVAYSKLIDGTYSKVYLDDIFAANNSINQFFIEVETGVDASDISGSPKIFNLPYTNIEWTNANKSGTATEKHKSEGIHFYNLGGAGSGIRYIISDNPKQRVMTTAAAWYESLLEAVVDPMGGGGNVAGLLNPMSFQTEDLKIAYGYEIDDEGKEHSIQLNTIDASKLLLKGYGVNSNDTADWTTDTKDVFYDSCNGNLSNIENQKNSYFFNQYTNKSSKYIYAIRNVGGEKSGNNKVVGGQNYVMKYTYYNAELPWFSDASNWMGNTQQFFQDVANTVGNALATAWKWLWSGGDDTHSPEEDGYFQGTDHYTMTFYQLPEYYTFNNVDNEFNVRFDSDAPREYNNSVYTITDDNYTSSTCFDVTIENLSATSSGGKFWGFELVCEDAPRSSKDFNGWTWSGTSFVYVYDKRLSSRGNVNLILQEGTSDSSITIKNLPAGYFYSLRVYSGKAIISAGSRVPSAKTFKTNISTTNDSLVQHSATTLYFRTGPNLVHNPYGDTLPLSTFTVPSGYTNGDNYLAENQYIDYEIQQFVFNGDNVNASTYTNNGYVDFTHPISGNLYRFSSDILMKKYLNTENVSKIAFYLKASGVIYTSTSQYMVWDISTGKTVAKGMFNHSDDVYKNDAYLNNIILYDLTQQDKLVLQNTYNNVIDSNFINNYLLKDKLVFHVKNTGGSSLDTSVKFEILWQAYYEETLAYLDYNQNGKYDKSEDVRPVISGKKADFYNIGALAVTAENATETRVEYDHLIYGSDSVNDTTKWLKSKFTITKVSASANDYLHPFEISYTNENGVSESGWHQLCIIKDGESHIIK